VFPCIVSVRKPESEGAEGTQKPEASAPVQVCPVPREHLENINLPQYVGQEGYGVPWLRFTSDAWNLEPPEVGDLFEKIKDIDANLKDFTGSKPFRGILTGYNKAFLIDDEIKNRLIASDSKCSEIIKPYLRGKDVARWHSDWNNLWMIFVPWDCPINQYPSVLHWLETHREGLEKRPEVRQGRFPWYAMSRYGSDYWHLLEQPKLLIQGIAFHPRFSLDEAGMFTNNSVFFLPSTDKWALAALNSPVKWMSRIKRSCRGMLKSHLSRLSQRCRPRPCAWH